MIGGVSKAMNIAIILEAAGNSTRYGSNKLLHIMEDGRPMICRILKAAGSQTVFRKILVTQYDEAARMAVGFDVVMNNEPELGISHSMQLGIEAAGNADQPWLTSATIKKLLDTFETCGRGIVSLSWNGRMSNPKIFSSRYRDELMNLSGDTGGRQIIASHSDDLLLVEAADEIETIDIDTNESLELQRRTK